MTFAEQLKTGFIGAAITCGAAPIPGGMVVWLYMIMRAADVPEDPRISTFVAMILTGALRTHCFQPVKCRLANPSETAQSFEPALWVKLSREGGNTHGF